MDGMLGETSSHMFIVEINSIRKDRPINSLLPKAREDQFVTEAALWGQLVSCYE